MQQLSEMEVILSVVPCLISTLFANFKTFEKMALSFLMMSRTANKAALESEMIFSKSFIINGILGSSPARLSTRL